MAEATRQPNGAEAAQPASPESSEAPAAKETRPTAAAPGEGPLASAPGPPAPASPGKFLRHAWRACVATVRLVTWPVRRCIATWIVRQLMPLAEKLYEHNPDKFVVALLHGMRWAFVLVPGYSRNIRGFTGTFDFVTIRGAEKVRAAAVFRDGKMEVKDNLVEPYSVKIEVGTTKDLKDLLFSGHLDAFDAMLANTVAVKGNLNYLCKFGFLYRDLLDRLGVQL